MEDPGFESRLRRDFFQGRVIPVTRKLALQWLPCQAPGVIGSVLGLVYCDWVWVKVWSATSISVWQHVKLSEGVGGGGGEGVRGGRNSSVGSAWARCPQCHGFDPPRGTFSGRGDFSLGVNMGSNSIPPKTPSDESINRGLVCAHMHFIARTQKILTFMS